MNFKKILNRLPFLFLVFCIAIFSFSRSKAESPVELSNNYEIALGSNIDSAVDDLGNTFVVYERSGGIYITKNREAEQLVGAGSAPALALDRWGNPHVAYVNTGSVIYESFNAGWDGEVNVGIGTGASYVDLDVDSNGHAHIFMRVHYYPDNYGWVDLLYVSNVNGSFEIIKGWNGDRDYSSSGSWGGYYYDQHPISIAIDDNDNYHLLFWHGSVWVWYADRDWSYSLQYHTDKEGASGNLSENHALYKNSLTIDALGRANILYGGIKYGLVTGGVWSTTDLISGSSPAIYASKSSVALSYVESGVKFTENFGEGFINPILIDSSGAEPSVATNGANRFVYFAEGGKIYLATDKAIYNAPVISGVEEGGLYNTIKTITWDNGLGVLNGVPVSSGVVVLEDGDYNITVTNISGQTSSVNFKIDATPPVITIDSYNEEPTNQDIIVNATTNEGTLNFESHTFTENGSFTFEATDIAGNKTTKTVTIINIDKVPPIITILPYEKKPTNQDIVVNATTNEGTLNFESHTFTENGSFTFEATDAVGNKSEVTITIDNIDRLAPVITLGDYEKGPTNQNIIVTATTDEGSLNATSHTFTENDSFEFVATDEAGNFTSKLVMVNNIDKFKPGNVSILSPSSSSFIRGVIAIQAEAQDDDSGINRIEFFSVEGGKISEDTLAPFIADINTTFLQDGTYQFFVIAYDNAGNSATSKTVAVSIDNTAPVITIDPYETDPTNEDIVVSASTNEGSLNQTSFTFTQNGSFEFVATDLAGNVTTKMVTISNIDKDGPEITIDPYLTSPTNQSVTVYASVTEGTLNSPSHIFEENGKFDFIATDSLGNQTISTVEITNIDKQPPTGSVTSIESGAHKRGIVPIVVDGADDGLGIEKVEFYHASVPTLIGTDSFAPYSVDWDTTKVLDGDHKVWSIIHDKAGNKAITGEIDIRVDNTAPIITISDYSTEPTTGSVTITASTNEGRLNQSSYTFIKNGSFEFIAVDDAGNQATKTVTINNIYVAEEPSLNKGNDQKESEQTSILSDTTGSQEMALRDMPTSEVFGQPEISELPKTEINATEGEEADDLGEPSVLAPEIKGENTEKTGVGWWRWWYILIIALIGLLLYSASMRKAGSNQ